MVSPVRSSHEDLVQEETESDSNLHDIEVKVIPPSTQRSPRIHFKQLQERKPGCDEISPDDKHPRSSSTAETTTCDSRPTEGS